MFKMNLNPLYSFLSLLSTLSFVMFLTAMYVKFSTIIILNYTIHIINSTPINIMLLFDSFSLIFSATVLFISSNIMLFSMFYMKEEKNLTRFTYLVILFILSMNLLIFIPNILTVLIGWDGLGIVSFILVIYYQNNKSLSAGMITALTNRIGDVLILLSLSMLFSQSHWNFYFMWADSLFNMNMIVIFLLLAFCTKSAQIPFSAWLPAAMAAPTPVSALVHSSTLVTAGVYLTIRFYPFLISYALFNKFLLIMSMSTMLMAGMAAMVENDMKKIIALSTLSQLGVMMAAISMNMPNLAFFHLITHAMFKALLFICAGIFINFHNHGQDLRSMGNIFSKLPITSMAAVLANLALCGAPFLAGFYSKDAIIENMLNSNFNLLSMIMFMFATFCTAAYSFRFITILFNNQPLMLSFHSLNDNFMKTLLPLNFMMFMALSGGAIISWLILQPSNEYFLPSHMKFFTSLVVMLGMIFSIILSEKSCFLYHHPLPHLFITSMWSLTPLSSQFIIPPSNNFALLQLKLLDQGWYEVFGPNGVWTMNKFISSSSANTQSMSINYSLLFMTLAASTLTLL